MLKYFKKFVLDILPSVVATIVGAYIVHHYIIPAATPDKPAAAVAAETGKPAAPPDLGATEKPTFVKGVAEKAAIEKAATEKSANEPAPADSKKRHTTARATKPTTAEQTASVPESATDERRDANGLARAAIERLRPSTEASRTVAAVPTQPSLPPLQPGVTLTQPSPEVFNAGTGAILAPARPALPAPPIRSADASRPLPPGSIPAGPPLELHDDIVTTTTGRAATVADDVMSAAKSVFHAVLPLK